MRGATGWTLAGSALLAAAALAGPAPGATPTTPGPVSAAFAQGFVTGDPAACDLATPRLQQLFARVGQRATCRAALAAARAADDAAADAEAREVLRETVQKAQVLADARATGTGTRRAWIGPRFRVAALVADLRAHDVTVRLAGGPRAARSSPTGLVFVDGARTTPTKLVLYTESVSGTIWRLTSAPYRIGAPTRATRGIASRPVPEAQAFPYPAPSGTAQPRVAVTISTAKLGTISFLLTSPWRCASMPS